MVFNRRPPKQRYMRADVRLEFQCSKCGGREWGSMRNTDGTLTRSCHTPGCHMRWHESADFTHFSVNGRRVAGRPAFERAVYTTEPTAPIAAMGVPRPPDDTPPEAA